MQDYPVVAQPKTYNRDLFNHQLTSIYEMELLEKNKSREINNTYLMTTNIGIQSDPTGYGKTCSMIGLLVRDKMEWNLQEDHIIKDVYQCNKQYQIVKTYKLPRIKTNLIVISQSLVTQWKEELQRTILDFEVIRTKKKASNLNVEDYDVVLCTPTMYNRLMERYKNKVFKRLLYDEPGTTQIPSMRIIQTGFTWFITATPEMIKWRYYNRRNHYISNMVLNYLENVFFRALQIRNDLEYVKSSYSMPPIHNHFYECDQPISRAIRGFVPTRVHRMISAGNLRGAIRYMGGGETDNIMQLVESRFNEELEDAKYKLQRYTNRNDQTRIDEWSEKVKRIEHKIAELKSRFENALENTCNICFEKLNAPSIVPCCQNLFCSECIVKWVTRKPNCPLCRNDLSVDKLVYIKSDTEEATKETKQLLSKAKQLVKIINEKPDNRFIIFSEEDETYRHILSELNANNIECKEIKGRAESRDKVIKNFKNGDIKCIFLNSKNNGAGINLQECTDIILYHKMETSIVTQILGRANRIGRTCDLHVHHLIEK
jgi:hypothetical protein